MASLIVKTHNGIKRDITKCNNYADEEFSKEARKDNFEQETFPDDEESAIEIISEVPTSSRAHVTPIPNISWVGMVSWCADLRPRCTRVYEVPEQLKLQLMTECLGKVDEANIQLSVNNVETVLRDLGVLEFRFCHDIAMWTCDCGNDLGIQIRLWQRTCRAHSLLFLETCHTNGDRAIFWDFYNEFTKRLIPDESRMNDYA